MGRFVEYLADSAVDLGDVPDERPLTGEITLTPLTTLTRWPTASPPRMAVPQKVNCRVINGNLCPPDSELPGVWVVATDQPEGQPTTIQWKASFRFNNVLPQPADVVFNVPDGGVVDLALVVTIPPAPPTIVVVSHETAAAAAASAAEAAQSAENAAAAASMVRLAPVAASEVTQGLYTRTHPTPTGAAAGLRALARDPLVYGRIWVQSQSTYALGYTDDHGVTWVSKGPIPAGPSAGVQGLYFVNNSAWILQGPGIVGRDGSLWRSPYPDANGNGLAWTKVFDLGAPPAGITVGLEAVMRNGIFAAEGPNLYLGEYCGLSQITGGPSLYYSPDSGQNWSKVKTWANARHIHEVRVIGGVPWVTLGDASPTWTDVGLWCATTAQATTWNRASVYGEANGGNTLYGIGFLPTNVGNTPGIILESDTHRGVGPLAFMSQDKTKRRALLPLNTVPPAYVGTMRSLTLTSEGNLMWLHTGEDGAVGDRDSVCISKGPYYTETIVLESVAAGYPPFGSSTGPGDPVEDGDYIWIAGQLIHKELFTGQARVPQPPVPQPPFVPDPPLTITNQWIAPAAGADGAALPSWAASVGTVALAQATPGLQPTLITTNGARYVRFDGVDDFMSGIVGLTQPTTVFYKAKIRTYNGFNAGLIYPNGSGFQIVVIPTGSITVGSSLVFATPGAAVTVNTDFVIAVVYNAGASRVSINGGAAVTGDVGTGGSNDLRVGYAFQSGSGRYAAIDVREIRMYRQVLTVAQVNEIVAAMM